MYTLTEWNWGLYKSHYSTLQDAEYAYIQAKITADLNHHPDPYLEDSNGNRIEVINYDNS